MYSQPFSVCAFLILALTDKFFSLKNPLMVSLSLCFESIRLKIWRFMNGQIRAARERVLEILQQNGIKRAAFFGSIVRGEMTDESDIEYPC